jgi:ACT domain-containing protein
MNCNALKANMVLKNINTDEMVNALGICRSAYFRKMNGTVEFTRDEIEKIILKLSLTPEETMHIFFENEVS